MGRPGPAELARHGHRCDFGGEGGQVTGYTVICLLRPSGDRPHLTSTPTKARSLGSHVTLEAHLILPGLIFLRRKRREGWMTSEVLSSRCGAVASQQSRLLVMGLVALADCRRQHQRSPGGPSSRSDASGSPGSLSPIPLQRHGFGTVGRHASGCVQACPPSGNPAA